MVGLHSWNLGNVDYTFIVIIPRSTLTRIGSTSWGPIWGRTEIYNQFQYLKLFNHMQSDDF